MARVRAGEDHATVFNEATAKRIARQASSESIAKAEDQRSGEDVD